MATRVSVIIDAADYFTHARSAMMQAKRRIMLIGWDFDTRLVLGTPTSKKDGPAKLGKFVLWLVNRNPNLHVYVLRWDIGVLKAAFRGTNWISFLKWTIHPRIHALLDHCHPPGASHHQKIVTIDDGFAFCGGIDMTSDRWDTPKHIDDDPRRVSPTGRRNGPWHDASCAVQGDAAHAINDIVEVRWTLAGGKPLAEPDRDTPAWPEALEPMFSDIKLGLACTLPTAPEGPVYDIEKLYVAMIDDAERFIYIETQYFASRTVAEAIARRLSEPDGPEIVIVHPENADGWLERLAMDSARARVVEALEKIDQFDRLRLYHPFTANGTPIYVHAKMMIVDDQQFRIGSSNLNNRSMRLDSECDLMINAVNDTSHHTQNQIAAIRNALLAEHLDVDAEQVAAAFARNGSLIKTISTLQSEGRSLRRYVRPEISDAEAFLADNKIMDPEGTEEMFEPIGKRRTLRARLSSLVPRRHRGTSAG